MGDAESSVTDVSTPRTYRICNNAVAKINAWNDENEVFDDDMGKMNGLSIYNSNVNIICGNDEDEIKNCTFDGGTFQIEVYSKEYYVSVKNVNIHGFKFIHASEENIMIYGADVEKTGLDPLGASIFIKDCVFLDNAVLATIKLRENYNTHLTVENSIFKTNKLIESYGTYNNSHAGIITSNVGGKIDISNSKFIDNDVETADYSNGIRAIVYAVEENADYSGNQHETYLSISNSTFLGNKGITYALIVGGLWNDGKLFESNNYESKNQPLLECYGIGRFTLDFDDYYYYYDYDVLLKTQCVAAFSNTGSILTPEVNQALTQVPTQIPTKKETYSKVTISPTFDSTSFPTKRFPVISTMLPSISTMLPSIKPSDLQFIAHTSLPTKAPTLIPLDTTDKEYNTEIVKINNSTLTSTNSLSDQPSYIPVNLLTISTGEPTREPTSIVQIISKVDVVEESSGYSNDFIFKRLLGGMVLILLMV